MIRPDHPVVRAMAEEAAREAHSAWEGAIRAMGGTKFLIEETLATRAMLGVDAETDAHAALLTDFTRPATRDAWVRWLSDWSPTAFVASTLRDNPTALEAAVSAALETM